MKPPLKQVDLADGSFAITVESRFPYRTSSPFQKGLGRKSERPAFSGGAVVNEREVPDYYETALRRIAEKRDMSDYSVRGRKNWLILSASSDPLFSADTFEKLFETNVELGQIDCIVAVRPSSFVRFKRVPAQTV